VEVQLDDDGIAWAECSCPMGSGGSCKHVVALLLTWMDAPDTFSDLDPLEQQLRECSRETLVDLIVKMVDRHPDLERLLSLSTQSTSPLDEEQFRSQVQSVFEQGQRNYYDDPWQATVDVAERLDDFLALGEDYLDHGRLDDAVAVFRCIAEEACSRYTDLHDESGKLAMRINTCTEHLASALETAEDPDLRDAILRGLFDVYVWNIDLGGYDIGYHAPDALLEHTTDDEQKQIAEWVREALPGTERVSGTRSISLGGSGFASRQSDWKRSALGGFLLELEADRLDDEQYLALCRKTRRLSDLVDRLLDLDRLDEALDVVREASDYEVTQLTDLFEEHNAADALHTHVQHRLDADTDRRLVTWLRDYEWKHGTLERALDLTRRLFEDQPSPTTYETLRTIARDLDRWEEVQSDLHERLREREDNALLTRLHLVDDDVDAALETVQKVGGASWSYRGPTLAIRVAEAAEDEHPEAAIELYHKRARALIANRGRDNYAQAATHMKRVKALFEREDRPDEWADMIEQLVEDELHRLPAGRDEFQKAGLLGTA